MFKILLFLSIVLVSNEAISNTILSNDPNRPVAALSNDLGVSSDQFINCFNHVSPAPKGTHPTSQETTSNKAVLMPCLQKANPKITDASLNQVMDKYRPGGYAAQQPANYDTTSQYKSD